MSAPSVRTLLETRAPAHVLMDAIPRLVESGGNGDEWAESVRDVAAIVQSPLDWIPKEERRLLHLAVVSYAAGALTKSWPNDQVSAEPINSMRPIIDWLADQDDHTVVQFCWDVLAWRLRRGWTQAITPVRWLTWNGRLTGSIRREYLDLAITFADDAESMYWWPAERWRTTKWEHASPQYRETLAHESHIVRAWGAKALGQLYFGCLASDASVPSVPETMAWIQAEDKRASGIAGAFLDGAHWDIDDWGTPAEGFDFRSWFLDTLRAGGPEPYVPHVQTLEFYAHEFFYRDADAIREMLSMGRRYLALLTATEEPVAIEEIRDVLEEMATSADSEVSVAIRTYLSERVSHAGLEHLRETRDRR